MIEVRLDLGAKTFACLVLEDIFRSGIGMIDGLHGVNVKSIKMYTNFSPEIISEKEMKKQCKKEGVYIGTVTKPFILADVLNEED